MSNHMRLSGKVVKGKQLGRTIGFPTANLQLKQPCMLQQGVYGVRVMYKGIPYVGMLNVGMCPTFQLKQSQTVEVHILHFEQMIYGEQLDVEIAFRIREEKKFPSVDALINQIKQDVQETVDRFYPQLQCVEVV